MEPVNMLDARNRLSQLVAAATNGEDVVIAKRGKPVVRIVPVGNDTEHTGVALAQWLASNPIPSGSARTPEHIDEQITREREAWE